MIPLEQLGGWWPQTPLNKVPHQIICVVCLAYATEHVHLYPEQGRRTHVDLCPRCFEKWKAVYRDQLVAREMMK